MVAKKKNTNLVALKLGGSIITQKDKPFEPDMQTIYMIAKDLSKFYDEDSGQTKLLIVHGGGGFSHSIASVYRVQKGISEEDKIGFPLTILAGRKLNDRLIEAMLDYGLPVFPLQPSSCFVSKRTEISKAFLDVIFLALRYRWIPVTYGDVLMDEKQGVSVLSGESLLLYLCRTLNPSKVIVCTDVDGIHSADPKEKSDAELIKEINSSNFDLILRLVKGSKYTDVTGGMAHKLMILYEISRLGAECKIVNGTQKGNIVKAIRGENVKGTLIRGS